MLFILSGVVPSNLLACISHLSPRFHSYNNISESCECVVLLCWFFNNQMNFKAMYTNLCPYVLNLSNFYSFSFVM